MPHVVLGLDIGGANLKAATADKRAVSVPFALWKQPDRLPAALAELVEQFPDITELAVTMTGELCDCYETKRQGVNAILDAVEFAATGRPVRVWGTDGRFCTIAEARAKHITVAAANWHALATFACRFSNGPTLLIDTGSTTTDIILLSPDGPRNRGRTDTERLEYGELVYAGAKRTPLCAVLGFDGANEFFATTLDVYLLLGMLAESPDDRDTADSRPATIAHAHARIARMVCADAEIMPISEAKDLALLLHRRIFGSIATAAEVVLGSFEEGRSPMTILTSGSGEFIARAAAEGLEVVPSTYFSLNELLGPRVSACAPAYALAVLATESE